MAMDGLDPRELDRIALLVERLSLNVERLTRAFGEIGDEVEDIGDDIEDVTDRATKQVYDVRYEVDAMFKWIERRALPRVEFGLLGPFFGADKLDRMLETADRKMKRWADEMKRHMEARGPFASMGKMTGLTSVGSGLGALKNQMFMGMPGGMGGLIGMALWGALSEERFAAAGRKALYMLQQVGGGGQKQLGELTAKSREFYRAFGEEGVEMLGQVAGSFAQFSIGEQQFEKASVAAKGFGDQINEVSLAVDLMMGQQPGTVGKLIGETVQSSGASVQKASDQVLAMTRRLRELGLNYGQFSTGIVQANSALRMQNQSLEGTTKLFEKLFTQLRSKGIDPSKAGAMALERLQGAAAATNNLPEGLQGLIAMGLAKRGAEGYGGMTNPFALLTRFRLGVEQGGETDFMVPVWKDLSAMFKKMAGTHGTPEEQRLIAIGALARVGGSGMTEKDAAAIIDVNEESLKELGQTKDWMKELNTSFGTYTANQSKFEVAMRQIQDEMAQIGGDILSFLVSSSEILINEIRNIWLRGKSVIGGTFFGGGPTKEERQQLAALDQLQMGLGTVQASAFSSVVKHVGTIVNIGKKTAEDATTGRISNRFGNISELRERYNEAVRAREGKEAGGARSSLDPTPIEKHQPKFKTTRYTDDAGGAVSPGDDDKTTHRKMAGHHREIAKGHEKLADKRGSGRAPSTRPSRGG